MVEEPVRSTSDVPRERGDEPATIRVDHSGCGAMFPASAGMNRLGTGDIKGPVVTYVPRERGDEPFPASAGMNRMIAWHGHVPRERGDEPTTGFDSVSDSNVPRERGDEPVVSVQW